MGSVILCLMCLVFGHMMTKQEYDVKLYVRINVSDATESMTPLELNEMGQTINQFYLKVIKSKCTTQKWEKFWHFHSISALHLANDEYIVFECIAEEIC